MMSKQYPTSFVIFITLFYGIAIFIIFTTVMTSGKDSLLLLIPLTLIAWDYGKKYEWNVFHHNPNFICVDGTIGVVESNLEVLHGGMARLEVSMNKSYVPEDKWYRLSGYQGLMSHLGGRVSYSIIDRADKFIEVPVKNRGAREGAILYFGSPSKKPSLDIFKQFEDRLADQHNEIMNLSTTVQKTKQLAHAMASSNNEDMKEVAKDLALILRDVGTAIPVINKVEDYRRDKD